MREMSRFFGNSWDWLWMQGHVLSPFLNRPSFLFQYLIFLTDLALAIRQQYLNVVLPETSSRRTLDISSFSPLPGGLFSLAHQ